MDDEDEIVGSDFIGSDDDEDKSVEALQLKLQAILQKKERLERQKKRDELLAKIKQAKTEVINLQPKQQVPAKHEIDKWSIEDLTPFFKAKGIILKDIPVQHLKQLAKSVSDANLPEYKIIVPLSTDRRTVKYKGKDITFPNITDSSLSRWSDDLSSLPSIEHVTAHAYILSSADFDLERFKNLRNEDSYKMYKSNCVRNIKIHVLQRGYEYVKGSCWLNSNDMSSSEVVWSLIQDDGCIQSAGCSCNEDNGCCKHVVALILTLASHNKSNVVVSENEDIVANSQKLSSNYKTKSIQKSDGDTSIKTELKEKPRYIKTDQGGDSNSFLLSNCDDESDTEPEVWVPPPSKTTVLTEQRSWLEMSKDQQRRESFKTREIRSGGTLPPSEPVSTIFNKNAKPRYNEDEQGELLLTTSELIEPTKPQTNRQIASRHDELLSQREHYSHPVDNKRGLTNDSNSNLRTVNKQDMDLDSKICQNLEEMKNLRTRPLMPESEMQSPSLKLSSNLTSLQQDFQFQSNFPMRSKIVEEEHHYPAKASPPVSVVPAAQQKIHTSTTFASNRSRFDSKEDNLHSFSPLVIDQQLLPGDIKCQSASTLKDTETILTSKTPNIETRTDHTRLTKHSPRAFTQKPDNPTTLSQYSFANMVPGAYHVARNPIVSRSEEVSSASKYGPMVSAQEQQKPIVQSKYNNHIEPRVQTTIQQQLVSGQTGPSSSNYGIQQQQQAVYPSSTTISNHSDQSTRGNLYPVTNPGLMHPSSNYSQPPTMGYQSKPIIYPSANSGVCMPQYTMNPNARMPVSSNAVNSISINSTTSVGNAFGRFDLRYPGAASNLHSPLVYPTHVDIQAGNIQISTNDVPKTTKQEKTCGEVLKSRPHNYQYDEPMIVEDDQPSIVKPKINRRERRFASPSVADTKERKTNEVKRKVTYDRTFLLKLSKSMFCKRKPDISHIPEIKMVDTEIHDSKVKATPLSYSAGYIRATRDEDTPKVTKKNKPCRGVSPKPMQKLLSAPDEAGLPVDSGLNGMSTEVTKKNKPRRGVSPKPMQKLLSAPNEAGLPVDSGLNGMSTEELMRKAIGAFNMLKNGSEPSMVLNIFSTLQINTEDGLTRIVNLVVDTAIDEPELTSTCASICRILSSVKVPSRNNPEEIMSFSMAYRQKCEKIIGLGIFSQTSESHQRRLEEITRFTENIARMMLIKIVDIHLILIKLYTTGSEKCLECFCILLTDVRERIAKCTSVNYMDQYDEFINETIQNVDITDTLRLKMLQLQSKLRTKHVH